MKIYFATPTGARKHLISYAMHTPDTIANVARFSGNALDNGAFKSYKEGRAGDFSKFIKRLDMANDSGLVFDFCVTPDIVAGGIESLKLSNSYIKNLKQQYPKQYFYLVVQDGMNEKDVLRHIHKYDGIFVGGTLPWKRETSERWVKLAHKFKKPCHLGRVGTVKRILWAKSIGADSVDSGLAMIHPHHLAGILNIKNSLLWEAI